MLHAFSESATVIRREQPISQRIKDLCEVSIYQGIAFSVLNCLQPVFSSCLGFRWHDGAAQDESGGRHVAHLLRRVSTFRVDSPGSGASQRSIRTFVFSGFEVATRSAAAEWSRGMESWGGVVGWRWSREVKSQRTGVPGTRVPQQCLDGCTVPAMSQRRTCTSVKHRWWWEGW